ncbi:MAG: hypothetical protein JW774_05555 [Candidatus Aureabacteria bacterium]|nr:hypothetical protein [Candidatus Auribacterota bacterium]
MKRLIKTVDFAAMIVFGICLYTFFLGNKTFQGKFDNDGLSWYFLAKGVFCSVSLILSVRLLDSISQLKKDIQ